MPAAINAEGSKIPFFKKIKLLNIAEVYWIIEICPNRKWIFDNPKMILWSLIIFINGKWYK